jgi:tetratricopeptide (TPR) repeat protein
MIRLRMRQQLLAALMAALCLGAGPAPALAADSAASLAKQALTDCEAGRQSGDRAERERLFNEGRELAKRAVALDDKSADAHFSLFCNQGEAMRLDGESLKDIVGLRALIRELDRTLEIQPDHAGALSAKGTFLVRLPRLLGGDVDRGEAMLQRVITLDPTAVNARISLARVCEYRGKKDEGIEYARHALQFAKELGRADKVAEAQAMLAELGASY